MNLTLFCYKFCGCDRKDLVFNNTFRIGAELLQILNWYFIKNEHSAQWRCARCRARLALWWAVLALPLLQCSGSCVKRRWLAGAQLSVSRPRGDELVPALGCTGHCPDCRSLAACAEQVWLHLTGETEQMTPCSEFFTCLRTKIRALTPPGYFTCLPPHPWSMLSLLDVNFWESNNEEFLLHAMLAVL